MPTESDSNTCKVDSKDRGWRAEGVPTEPPDGFYKTPNTDEYPPLNMSKEKTHSKAVAEEAVAEEAVAKEVEKPASAKTFSKTPDPADTACYPSLATPKAVGKSEPAAARSGSGPGYVDGVEADVRRLGKSVVYQATPADGKKSPSPGVPTSGGIAPVAPKPLGASAAVGLADAASREYYLAVRDKAMAAILLTKIQRAKLDAERSGRGCNCRRKAMRCRNNPKFGKAKGRRKSGRAKGRRKSSKGKGRGRSLHRRPKPRCGPQTPPCKSPSGAGGTGAGAGAAAGTGGGAGAGGACCTGVRTGLKQAAGRVQSSFAGAPRAIRMCVWSCLIRTGLCASVAGPAAAAIASAFSSPVASTVSLVSSSSLLVSTLVFLLAIACGAGLLAASGKALPRARGAALSAAFCLAAVTPCLRSLPASQAAASAFSSAVASTASTLASCSPLVMPALVIVLLAIACGGSWPVRSGATAVCLAAAACLPGAAAAAPAGLFSSSALAWLTESVLPISAVVAVGAFAFVGNLARLRWRRGRVAERRRRRMGNSTKAIRVSPAGPASNPPSPPEPEEAGPSSSKAELDLGTSVSLEDMHARGSMKTLVEAYDKDGDGDLDSEEVVDVVADVRKKQRVAEAAQKEARAEMKLRIVFKKFAIVLFIALAVSVLGNAGLTTAIVYLSEETHVENTQCDSKPIVAVVVHGPSDESNAYWRTWKRGAASVPGVELRFVSVGFNVTVHVNEIRKACGTADALVTSVPYARGTLEYAAIDVAINGCLSERPTMPVISTDSDSYHNPSLYAYVGPNSYDTGVMCGRALLFTVPLALKTEEGLDLVLGRSAPPSEPIDEFRTSFPGGRVPVYLDLGETANDALQRRFRGIQDTLARYGGAAYLTKSADEGRIVTLSGAWIDSLPPTSSIFICGDEVYESNATLVGFSPFTMGMQSVSMGAAAVNVGPDGWRTVKGNSGANADNTAISGSEPTDAKSSSSTDLRVRCDEFNNEKNKDFPAMCTSIEFSKG